MASINTCLPKSGKQKMTAEQMIAIGHVWEEYQRQQQLKHQQLQKQQHEQLQHEQLDQQEQQQDQQLQLEVEKEREEERKYFFYSKTFYNGSNVQKIWLKSTLNPNAKEFFPRQRFARDNSRYAWSSGCKCNSIVYDRPNPRPPNGWICSGTKVGQVCQRNMSVWSHYGGFNKPQCCVYGLKRYNVTCYRFKPFVCEASDELLSLVRLRHCGTRL